MSKRPVQANEYASLFVSITGSETVTEHQHLEYSGRIMTDREDTTAADVFATMRADGLEDAIGTLEVE